MKNYFELFALEADFAINLKALEQAYQAQIAQYHPDKFATQSDKEKSLALQNTSLINSAFDTLSSPLLRATYLLELQGINAFDEKDTQMDASFLINQITLRESLEAIENAQDELALDNFIEEITDKTKQNIEKIQSLFALNEFETIRNLVRELKFYTQLNTQAKQLMDEWL